MREPWINPSYHEVVVSRLVAAATRLRVVAIEAPCTCTAQQMCSRCRVLRSTEWVEQPIPKEVVNLK